MIDLLIELFENAASTTPEAARQDFVLVIGINHRHWFLRKVLPVMEYERFHHGKQDTPEQINGIEIKWTEEHPNLFVFIERKHIDLEAA